PNGITRNVVIDQLMGGGIVSLPGESVQVRRGQTRQDRVVPVEDPFQQCRRQLFEYELAAQLQELEVSSGRSPGLAPPQVRDSQPELLGKRRRVEVPPGRIEDPEVVRVEVRLQIPAKRGEAEENGKGPPVFVPIDLTDHCLEWQIQF